uniref:Reverse transcriptase domain-containing protein n=1 Tax=Tanacetum cinerariifolium TaxID=118510 RepID=A0A6L2L4Z6_TANCI|nr:reverse transcriptase domain-containing protein [Tanacetum cinerariifolium]
MSTMANTTPIVTTVTKATNKEKVPREADAALKVNILEFYEEHYEDILPGSQNSSTGTLPARYRNPSERPKMWNRLRQNDENVFDRLGHRRDRRRGIEESYGNTCSSYRIGARHRYHSRDKDRSRSMKKGRESESPLSRASKSGTSDGGHWMSKSKRRKPTWSCEEMDPFTPRIRNFKSSQKTRMPNNVKTYDVTEDPEDHVKIFQAAAQVIRWAMPTWCHMFNSTLIGTVRVWFDELPPESIDEYKDLKASLLAYFMRQKKYFNDLVEIHNIKQRDGETIEDFIERFKVEIRHMKGAPECMRISRFMHGVNNPELTKHLNEHVPKNMEEMMTTTTAFIRGEAVAASKKKVHTSTPKEILAAEAGKFKLPPPMVTPVEKRSNKFCKISYLIKEIKQCRDQPKLGKKEVPAKEKSMAIYMVRQWHRMTRQKVTQSFARVREITFPPLATSSGTEGPLVIKAKIGRHMIHHMYVDREENGLGLEGARAIQVEVQKLVEAWIMREVYYHDWLSNLVMDCYPLLKIDWKVESLYGYLFKCFLDAYKGYHQIHMAKLNEEKMAFHTSQGVYCYTKIPFGLKNAGATYQRLVDKAFDSQVGRNIEVYIDDLTKLHQIRQWLKPRKSRGHCVWMDHHSLILTSQEGMKFTYALRFQFITSNNGAEYEALIDGLRITAQIGVPNVYVSVDTKLVANQVLGTYVAKEENMIKFLKKAKSLEIEKSSRIDDKVVQDQRQRDDYDLQYERQNQHKEADVEPRRSKKARTEKSFGPDLFLLW